MNVYQRNGRDGKEVERVLKALANRRRLAIIWFLKEAKEASVGEIAEEIKLSFRATSRHLNVLSGAGILDREQRSLQIFYFLVSNLHPAVRTILTIG
ncbi:MAG: metalloregulator ArsR/SmtB family transcription factor [bacterium]|nr:metalloregulator ArsR/SmtB family transcription factor [bacterium]